MAGDHHRLRARDAPDLAAASVAAFGMNRKQTMASAGDGRDAFTVVAERLHGTRKPIDSILGIADELPAGREFKAFAAAHALAMALYENYLEADAEHHARATKDLADVLVDAGGRPIHGTH